MTYGLVASRDGRRKIGQRVGWVVVFSRRRDDPGADEHGGMGGTSSAEIIRPGGFILTNDHVISPAVNGGTVVVGYSDGRSSPPPSWDETS